MFRFKSGLALGLSALLISCQWSGVQPLNSGQIRTQNLATQLNFPVDGDGDTLTHNRFRDFDQGLIKDNLDLLTQGELVLKSGQTRGRYLSPVLKTPFLANSILPGWQAQTSGSAQILLQLRYSPDGKDWSQWMPLIQERSLSLPKEARLIQYDIRFVNPRPDHATPRFTGLTLRFGNRLAPRQPLPFQVFKNIAKPPVVGRSEWGAMPPKADYNTHTPDGIVVHHTWKPRHADYHQTATIRGIQRYHMQERNWNDIGYHFLIGPEGTIYQGRPETVIGAHSTPNTGKIGICMIGDFDPGQDPLTDASRAALLNLLTWLTSTYQIQTAEFYGHRDFSPKSCPGEEVYRRLDAFKEEVRRRLGLEPQPEPPSPSSSPDGFRPFL